MIFSGLWGKGNIGVNRNETTSSSRKSYISSKSACRQSSGCSAWVRLQRSGWKVAVWFQVRPQRYPTSEGAQPLLQPSSPNNEVFSPSNQENLHLWFKGLSRIGLGSFNLTWRSRTRVQNPSGQHWVALSPEAPHLDRKAWLFWFQEFIRKFPCTSQDHETSLQRKPSSD